jgi:carbonic anhydrase
VSRRITWGFVALLVLVLVGPRVRAQEPLTGAKALDRLKAGNVRFAADKSDPKNVGKERREELAKGQHPFAIVLTCADSRVTPEMVFDTGLGELFVLRVAGNVTDPAILGSIEFAVQELRVPLIVVMGHESCGAVKAAIDGGPLEGNLNTLIKMVDPGKDLPKDAKAALAGGIKNNVQRQAQLLTEKSKVIKEMAESKRVGIASAVYALDTGKVDWLETKAGGGIKAVGDGPNPVATKKTTTITLRVPTAEARVWIDSKATTSRGVSRTFETPALAVGKEYSYQIKATWVDGGKEVTREKTVTFKGGEPATVEIK